MAIDFYALMCNYEVIKHLHIGGVENMNNGEWISSWGFKMVDLECNPMVVQDETQHMVIKNNVEGDKVRLLLSNECGRQTLKIEEAFIALSKDGKNIDSKSRLPITVHDSKVIELLPGKALYSDPLDFKVSLGQDIVISMYVKDEVKVDCIGSMQSRVLTKTIANKGNTSQNDSLEYTEEDMREPFYALAQVEVFTTNEVKGIVAFGDSITNHAHWVSELGKRLYKAYPGKVAIINKGISGNRILHDASRCGGCMGLFGEAGVSRFEKDTFGSNKTDVVIVLEGVNDLIHPGYDCDISEKVSSNEMIEGLKGYVETAHKHKAKIFLCTILPFNSFMGRFTDEMEQKRQEVNEWIRTNKLADGYFDFADYVKDESDETKMDKKYDCGDNLHPSAVGGKKMAEEMELEKIMEG